MKKTELLISVLTLLVVGLFGYVIYLNSKTSKVGYVRSAVILEKYKGKGDLEKALEKKILEWQSNVDTLEANYKKAQDSFEARRSGMNERERKEAQEMLDKKLAVMEEYVEAVEKKAEEENQKLTQGMVSRIDQYIKKFADEHGYDLILGVTLTGNILYGNDGMDVTDELLTELNEEYSGK